MVSNTDMGFLAVTLAIFKLRKQKKKRTRRWSKEWFKLRSRFTHENLLNVLRDTEPEDYKNFLRMDQEGFETLLELVRPKIEKQDTIMRKAIPASQRLSRDIKISSVWHGFGRFEVYVCYCPSDFGRHHNGNL
ncbi:unnamed protein product [Macrosiphum euphorbiae]|uniref:Uncharacterized protein n=1 Tax=Macrosiphum euphorbiae TaxID=13131 RepID=A0AAV0XRQ6_9HEMI|nr:unnamed protein product [Macrosiphum euphorbiae]